jgi:hypothetical protein
LDNYSPYELHFKSGPVQISRYQLNPQTGICNSIAEYIGAVRQKFNLIREMLNDKHKRKQQEQHTKSARDSKTAKLIAGSLVYMLMPDASRLRDTRSKKIVLNWVGPMIIYKLDGRGNAFLQRLDGKLLCNIISTRRLKPAYIRTRDGKLLTTKKDILLQLSAKEDPFAKELKRGLLPDYLQFEDAEGRGHETPDTLMVMTCPMPQQDEPEINPHPEPQLLNTLSAKSIHYHWEKTKATPYLPGEFDVIKCKFIKGILNFLIKRSDSTNNEAFYIACTEGLGCEKTLQEIITHDIKVIGNPNNPNKKNKTVPDNN